MLEKMLIIVFSIDICTRHSSKNVDLNICAHTRHSVSVLGHKQGFEFALPVLIKWLFINKLIKHLLL